MKTQEKFIRFCIVWFVYLILSIPILKYVLVPKLGDYPVVISVLFTLLVWIVFFWKWGPIRGNWKHV